MEWLECRAEYFTGDFPVAQISDGFLTHCASLWQNSALDAMNDWVLVDRQGKIIGSIRRL